MDSMHGQHAPTMTQDDRYRPQTHGGHRPRASALGRHPPCILGQHCHPGPLQMHTDLHRVHICIIIVLMLFSFSLIIF